MTSRLFSVVPFLFAAAIADVAAAQTSPVKVAGLSVEHAVNPVGIGNTQPRLSWKLASARPGEKQTGYQVRAASTLALLSGTPDLFDTGQRNTDDSVLVDWPGKPLASRGQAFWQVRVWDKEKVASAWSEPASIELGILNPATEWKGQWITSDLPRYDIIQAPLSKANWISAGSTAAQAAAARLVVTLPADAKVLSASLDGNADGLLSLYVNGTATKQGPSSHTAPFHADFGPQLIAGRNVIAIGAIAVRRPTPNDKRNAIAAHLSIDLASGQRIEFNTDAMWKAAVNPAANWFAPGFDDSVWEQATVHGPYETQKVASSADSTVGPGRYLRKTFNVSKPVTKARLYSTALGTYEASINGKPINDHRLDPGWTDYSKRVMVQTTDVTALITQGQNTMGTVLTDGWFAGRVGWMGLAQYAPIGQRPLFNAQLAITYADGTSEVIPTDASWKSAAGEIVGSDQQLGEVIDGRRSAWSQPEAAWGAVVVDAAVKVPLVPQVGPAVRKLMEIVPQKITKMGSMYVVDLGQNIVGHVRLRVKGAEGTTVQLQHAEMLNADGMIYNENLRQAISLDTFILKGTGQAEVFEPHFTFHGFRYVQITGYPGDLTADDLRGIVVGSDTPDVGTFETSNADINRLWQNIRWGQRGNFLSVPTDCPQRDERMGWMGDAQVFAPTSARNADVAGFFTKWMTDVRDGQRADGQFNNVNPAANQLQSYPVWADAGVVIPWEMYLAYGDKAFLADNYEAMARWVDYGQRAFPALLRSGGVGDHLAPVAARGGAGAARGAVPGARGAFGPGAVSPTAIVDTAYFAHSAWILSQSAALLGKPQDAAKYDALFHAVTDAFNKAYVQADGTITSGTQTCYVLALEFNLLPENLRAAAAKHLTDDIQERAHLTTGFVGVGLINPALTHIGRSDLAYQLLFNDTYPSWLFTVKHGATTMWERWDGYTPTTGFQASSMNSFNHYSFGAVGLWLYSGVAGIQIDPAKPGYRHFILHPQVTGKLGYAKATYETPYGTISSGWRQENGRYVYDAVVPPNSTADFILPAGASDLKAEAGLAGIPNGGRIGLDAGSYRFSFVFSQPVGGAQ